MSDEPTTGGEEQPKHPGGRPTICTPTVVREFAQLIAAGNYFETVCKYLSIDKTLAYDWLHFGEKGKDATGNWPDAYREFSNAVKRADAQAEIMAVAEVQLAGKPHAPRKVKVKNENDEEVEVNAEPGAWQAMMTFLERRFSDRWGRKDRQDIGLHGTPGQPPVTFSHLSAEEAIEIIGNGGPYRHEGGDDTSDGDTGTDAGD